MGLSFGIYNIMALFNGVVVFYELYGLETLGDLTGLKMILVAVPETPATSAIGMMADPEARKKPFHVRVRNLSFEGLRIKRAVLAIDA